MKRCLALSLAVTLSLSLISAASAQTGAHALSLKQWIRSEGGQVQGSVVVPKSDGALEAVPEVEVVLSRRDGSSFRVATDAQGGFRIDGVEPGVYAMSVWHNRVLAACALHVIDARQDPQQRYPSSALVSIADVDRPTVKTAIIRYLPPGVRTAPQFLSGVDFARLATKVGSTGNPLRIKQVAEGLTGRIYLAGAEGAELSGAAMSNVFLLKDGNQVDRTLTDENGAFRFEQLLPGVYSMLAIGPGGIGLMGFELTPEVATGDSVGLLGDATEQLVSTLQAASEELAMQLAPVPEAVESMDMLLDESVEVIETVDGVPLVLDEACCFEEPLVDACCAPVCGGGVHSGGGGGFGGGGGGGGGGLGGIGALVGLGAVIAATSNDDNAVIIPRPASPAIP